MPSALRSRLLCACVVAFLLAGSTGRADFYTFQPIDVLPSGSPADFGADQAAVNNSGTVAFFFETANGGTPSILKSNGGSPTTVVTRGDVVPGQGTINFLDARPSINGAGVVAFQAAYTISGLAILTGDGSGPLRTFTTIASTNTPGNGFANLAGSPMINTNGTVAFRDQAASPAVVNEVRSGSGGPTTLIATSAGTGSFSLLGTTFPSLNDGGTVVFHGSRTVNGSPDEGTWVGNGVTTTPLVDEQHAPFNANYIFGNAPDINDAGTAVFFAMNQVTRVAGLYTGSVGGPVTLVADSTGAYGTSFSTADINNLGEVVFTAPLRAGGSGVFTGADPVANRVIATGDPLDGSTVTDVSFGRAGLNDLGQVAFWAQLADGRTGIFLATPSAVPEPGSLSLAGLAAAGLFYGAWRKRRPAPARGA